MSNKEKNNLNEEQLQTKFVPKAIPTPNIGVDLSNELMDSMISDSMASSSVDMSIISSFRTISERRENLYKIYDDMSTDVVIGSALELYADNATEYNSRGEVIWAESDDPEISKRANRLLKQLKLDESAWGHIYALCKYGDLYLETFRKSEVVEVKEGRKNFDSNIDENKLFEAIEKNDVSIVEDVIVNKYSDEDHILDYIETVPNPAPIFTLIKRGKIVGYLETNLTSQQNSKDNVMPVYDYAYNSQDIKLFDPTKYIHIYLHNPSNRFPEKVRLFKDTPKLSKDKHEREKELKNIEFNVRRGKSILYDIFKNFRELKLLEDSILLNRVVRSAVVRIFQVEVGDMGKSQVTDLLYRIKNMMEQKTALNTEAGVHEYGSPAPIENNIYVPKRDGKGGIELSNVGGDVEVGGLEDLDYFNNKLFAGLKVPKPFLGFMDDNAGFSGGESLAKVSSSFAKTIKRIQNSYIQGVKTLLNITFLDKGLSNYVNNFDIKMVSPSTLEDSERNETLNTTIEIVRNLMDLFTDVSETKDRLDILRILLADKLNMEDLTTKLDDIIENLETELEEDDFRPRDEASDELDDSEDYGEMGNFTRPNRPDSSREMGNFTKPNRPDSSRDMDTIVDDTESSLPSPTDIDIDLSDNEVVARELGEE